MRLGASLLLIGCATAAPVERIGESGVTIEEIVRLRPHLPSSSPTPTCKALRDGPVAVTGLVEGSVSRAGTLVVWVEQQGELRGRRFQETGAGTCHDRPPGQGCDPQNPEVFCKQELEVEAATLVAARELPTGALEPCARVPLEREPVGRTSIGMLDVAVETASGVRHYSLKGCTEAKQVEVHAEDRP